MDTSPFYQPQSIAPILDRAAQTQAQYISQPTGFSGALPSLGNLSQSALDVAANNQKKQSILAAQQIYSDYLAKIDSGASLTPEDHSKGRMAGMALGIQPKDPPVKEDPYIVDPAMLQKYGVTQPTRASQLKLGKPEKTRVQIPQDQANALRKKMGLPESTNPMYTDELGGLKLLAPPKPSTNADQQLTPDEMSALRKAATRKSNPLPLSMVNFRGPRAKIMAQSLIQDPTWSPSAGESDLASAKAGATAEARLDRGGMAQQSARAANTVIMLTDGLQKASDAFSRGNARFMNIPINAINEQMGTEAMTLKQYLVDTRTKMATALQGGGVPQAQAQATIAENFPDTMTASQIPVAIKNIKNIMRTQISGAMTHVSADQGNPSPQSSASSVDNDPLGIR